MSSKEEHVDSQDMEIETNEENQNKNITLDLSTIDKIPQQLHALLEDICKCKNYSQFDAFNAIVIYSAFENAFYGDWLDMDLTQYTLSWCSSFNLRVLQHCTIPENCMTSPLKLTFKFTLEQSRKVILNSFESGDLAILSFYETKDLDDAPCCLEIKSVAIPISRYIPFKKLCEDNLSSSFRNLKELSITLKRELFIPIRNQIYNECAVQSTPWLNGLPECVLVKILRYLNKKDLSNLRNTCHKQFDICKAFASNKKRKFE